MSKEWQNPFKNSEWQNPGKTFEESQIRLEEKLKKIKEINDTKSVLFEDDELEFLERQKRNKPCKNLKSKFFTEEDSVDYVYFDLDKMEESMNQNGKLMPNFSNFEEFEEWLESDCEDKLL